LDNFDWKKQITTKLEKLLEQKIMVLEVQIKFLEKQKVIHGAKVFCCRQEVILFDMMIDLPEKKHQIDIRKNSYPNNRFIQSKITVNRIVFNCYFLVN
jgi:transposase